MSSTDSILPHGVVAYRMEYKHGDPCFYRPEDFVIAMRAGYDSADAWPLYPQPQVGCSDEVDVYWGKYFIQPKYSRGWDLKEYIPLYRGPQLIHKPQSEAAALLFPSLVEDQLKRARPDLYPR